jgi:hypothetical protein
MRQDNNGNQYVVATYPTHDEADAARAEFEARGHKQTYWVEAAQPRNTTSGQHQ